MKIAFLTENFHRGGLDTFLVNLVNCWPAAEDELTIYCNPSHLGVGVIERALRRPCRVVRHEVALYSELVLRGRHGPAWDAWRRLISPLLKSLFFAYGVVAFGMLLRRSGADRLMVVNGGHPGGESCRAAAIGWGLCNRRRPPAIYNFHNLVVRPRWFERAQEWLIDCLLVKCSGRMIAVSRACADSAAVRPLLARCGRPGHIYNGIEPAGDPLAQAGDLRRELDIPQDSPVCLMLATYEPRKGHRFLLEAFAGVLRRVPDARLVICGDGYPDEIAVVTDLVRRFGLEQSVHLLGFRENPADLLRQADLLVVASQQYESFGLTSVEAMALRIPVVATRMGGIPEVVADGDGGVCVSPGDVEGFTANIVKFLQNRQYAAAQGELGHQRYLRLFTAERMAREYAELIRAQPESKTT